jgi:putative tryptophan/tyrosine transport system substrate-binding protein
MRRREFLGGLGGAAVAWPIAPRAQQPDRVRRIGVLQAVNESDPEGQLRKAPFVRGLQKFGWTDGANVMIDYRWGATTPTAFAFTRPNSPACGQK